MLKRLNYWFEMIFFIIWLIAIFFSFLVFHRRLYYRNNAFVFQIIRLFFCTYFIFTDCFIFRFLRRLNNRNNAFFFLADTFSFHVFVFLPQSRGDAKESEDLDVLFNRKVGRTQRNNLSFVCLKTESCICFFYRKVGRTHRNNLSFVCLKS